MTRVRLVLLLIISNLIFSMSSSARQSDTVYKKEWDQIEELMKKELPASALEVAEKVYASAKARNQELYMIKARIYMTNLQNETRENNDLLSLAELEKELEGKTPVARAILQSIIGERYQTYYSVNAWRSYQRTDLEFEDEDISLLPMDEVLARAAEHYKKSIAEEELLQQTKVEAVEPILATGNSRHLRPTVYDLLAYRALQFFQTERYGFETKSANSFELDEGAAFDPASDFIHHKFSTSDTSSRIYNTIRIYQRLIAFHLRDEEPDALIDADLERIKFVREQSTHPDKDVLYYVSLKHLADQFNNLPAVLGARVLIAKYHLQRGSSYDPFGDTTHRYEKARAREILLELQKLPFDSTRGNANYRNELKETLQIIEQKEIFINLELVNTPSQPFRASVLHKNVNKVYLRILKWDADLHKSIENRWQQNELNTILQKSPVRQWEQSLPVSGDFQQHRTEIKIDGLPAGKYVLIAGANPGFNGSDYGLGFGVFHVSGISYFNRDKDFFVVDRETGQPLVGAQVLEYEKVYDRVTSTTISKKRAEYVTDKNGYFRTSPDPSIEKTGGTQRNHYEIRFKGDALSTEAEHYKWQFANNGDTEVKPELFVFTDRGIYRPGQTVHVKGILMKRESKGSEGTVVANRQTKIFLNDVYGENIDSATVTTNEYGSFSVRFTLPMSGLTGSYSIASREFSSYQRFQVEEYKRPKFEVTYETIKETYRVGDSIHVTGLAKAYAGNNIDGASVSYRVVREAHFPYPRWGRGWWPRVENQEIANGFVSTDAEGKFKISFDALADKSIASDLNPYFNYRVYADVTDLNGETRSGSTMVVATYTAIQLNLSVDDKLSIDSINSIKVKTANMSGEFVKSDVKATVWRLKTENRLIRKSYWGRADLHIMGKAEFIKYFPNDEYAGESDFKNWEREKEIISQSDSTRTDGKWNWKNKKWSPGFYVAEFVTKDPYGKEVKVTRYFELYDPKQNKLNKPEYLWVESSKPIEPGESTSVILNTSAANVFLIQATNRPSKSAKEELSFSTWKSGQKKFAPDATEADRGGYHLSWAFVKNNRFYSYDETVNVPWTNKDLQVEYLSWRDKTLPGSEEKWKLRITGHKKDIVAAELLASMYDASLDQFYEHNWYKPGIRYSPAHRGWNANNFDDLNIYINIFLSLDHKIVTPAVNDEIFSWFGYLSSDKRKMALGGRAPGVSANRYEDASAQDAMLEMAPSKIMADADGVADSVPGARFPGSVGPENPEPIQTRKNFNETTFFLPHLYTDSTGAIEFSFTLPEVLTRWKFQAFAHTKDLAFALSSKEIITQKELMVQPNPPRFLREGDQVELSAKVVNLSENELAGETRIELLDATTMQPVTTFFGINNPQQGFRVAAGLSGVVSYQLAVPKDFNQPITWRLTAKAGNYSDGEEANLPVLSNRVLVTESMPLFVKGTGTRKYNFDRLKNSANSSTLQHQSVTVEYSSNPAWYAVQALPYLMEYPYDCAEQTWNRYYANALASHITNSAPRLREMFDRWKNLDTAALFSNLQKNEDLKNILLEETPWVLEAKSETEQKKNIALLFDLVRMRNELGSNLEKLKQAQKESGAFPWFAGGPDDRFVTQYIITGIGHLRQLNAIPKGQEDDLMEIANNASSYLNYQVKKEYESLLKAKTDLNKYTLAGYTIQYLYMKSFFPDWEVDKTAATAVTYFNSRLPLSWNKQSKYLQSMIALALHREGNTSVAKSILKSLKETSINNDELGRYHKTNTRSWWWYEAPLETQALLIEAFTEINKDIKTVDELRTWLLRNKQTNRWETTKATAEAVYALLLRGTDWLKAEPVITIKLGTEELSSKTTTSEAATGYFKHTIEGKDVKPGMGSISVKVENPQAGGTVSSSWGAVYWQYFEDMDKVTKSATPMQLNRRFFIQRNSNSGPVLEPITGDNPIKLGDKVVVRIELKVDRDMEYVHMKDLRASGLEPTNVLSAYKWQDGLGYYESTRDAATHFFFDRLNKGTYVFEYSLFANNAGEFSTGVTSIECMYAPEFRSTSEGGRFTILR